MINLTHLFQTVLSDFGLFVPHFGAQYLTLIFHIKFGLFTLIWFVMPWFKLI